MKYQNKLDSEMKKLGRLIKSQVAAAHPAAELQSIR